MANKDYGQTYYPLDSKGFDAAVDMEQLAESLEGRTVMSFDSTSARDTALASLTTAQKRGVIAHVAGVGWFGWNGTSWEQFSTQQVKRGRVDTVVEGNGFARIPSSSCFFNGSPPAVINANGINAAFVPCWDGTADGAGVLLRVGNGTGPSSYWTPGSAVAFYWSAYK